MWNPYPTRSKPVPIGKKHTNQPRTKARQRQENTKKRNNEYKMRQLMKFRKKVSEYWKWEREDYPTLTL